MTDVDNNNLVSIIVPAYNAEKYISDMIESVLQQTYPYFELIIVDDASTDRTAQIVQSFRDKRIKLIRHTSNKGPGAARNTAIEAASGKWMAVLDADDQWQPNRLERLVGVLQEAGDDYFVADDLLLCFNTSSGLQPWGRQFQVNHHISFGGNNRLDCDFCSFLRFKVPLIKPIIPLRHVREFNLYYDPNCFYGEDLEFVCHLFRTGLSLRLIAEPLYLYRVTPGSLTSKVDNYEHLLRVYEKLIITPGFSRNEKLLLKELHAKVQIDFAYVPFLQAVKQQEFAKVLLFAVKHPIILVKLVRRLLRPVRYRLATLRRRKVGQRWVR